MKGEELPEGRAIRLTGRESPPGLADQLVRKRIALLGVILPSLRAARPQSSALRVEWEAGRFLKLFSSQLLRKPSDLLASELVEEAISTSFAAASPDDVTKIFAVWRRGFGRVVNSHADDSLYQGLSETLDKLEERLIPRLSLRFNDRLQLIVVASSAGGIGALSELLEGLDSVFPASLVLVQHLGRAVPSVLPTVLGRRTGLVLSTALDGADIWLGHGYFAPPNSHVLVRNGKLVLTSSPRVNFARPSADVLFHSAAKEYGRNLISVVLSGSGRDGAGGTQEVRRYGGITLAQEPGSAEFSGMPNAAIATGAVQYVATTASLGAILRQVVSRGRPDSLH